MLGAKKRLRVRRQGYGPGRGGDGGKDAKRIRKKMLSVREKKTFWRRKQKTVEGEKMAVKRLKVAMEESKGDGGVQETLREKRRL